MHRPRKDWGSRAIYTRYTLMHHQFFTDMEAGMDGMEIHGAQGHLNPTILLLSYQSRYRRMGSGPDGRLRFLLNILHGL